MFKKFVAVAATLLVATSLSLTGVVTTASAETAPSDPTASSSDTTATTVAADAAPAADAPTAAPTSAAAPAAQPAAAGVPSPDATPVVVAAVAAAAPACIPASAVSYTYDPATNSGDVVVPVVAGSTGILCDPFWLTAASWRYTTDWIWPQKRDVVQMLPKISTPGTYHYAAAVTCGQGDIYASSEQQIDPTQFDYLHSPGNPVYEVFLSEMGFVGPVPTYTTDPLSCLVTTPVAPTATAITECGTYGSISVPANSASTSYTVTGSGLTGVYVVTAKIASPYMLAPGATTSWTFDLGTFEKCAVVPTDVTPSDPTATAEVCTAGIVSNGSILIDLKAGLIYSITSVDRTGTSPTISIPVVTTHETKVPAGEYVISVAPATGYVLTGAGQWPITVTVGGAEGCGDLPTFSVQPVNVTTTSAVCTPTASSSATGTITVGQVQGVDFTPYVRYSIDGAPATSVTTAVAPGTHRVTAVAAIAGDTLEQGPNTLADGTAAWSVTIAAAATLCGELTTLALPVDTLAVTGTDATPWLIVALALLLLGATLVVAQFRTARRRQLPNRSH